MAGAGSDRKKLLVLDGSEGEGGGQILRSALSLSLVTGRPFRIDRIRAGRKPGGLRPQHLACVRGAVAISGARCEGAQVGSSELEFWPGAVKPGEYLFEVGTAGSAPLLFQCLYYPLVLAGESRLTLRGGTHVPNSPSYHYLAWVWLPMLSAFGLTAQLQLRRAGFYPEGGGEFKAAIGDRSPPQDEVSFPARGTLRDMDVTSFVGGLSFDIAERQAGSAVSALREKGIYCSAENLPLPTARSKGTMVFIRAQFEHTLAGFTALGHRGHPAEEVGREAAEQVAEFMQSSGALDLHLADQILLPAGLLASGLLRPGLAGETLFSTAAATAHLKTNATVVEKFLPARVMVEDTRVRVHPAAASGG
jgi:RNA 3'-terminal phosphate cyclase (ATP)